MKKTYITPAVDITIVAGACQTLVGSPLDASKGSAALNEIDAGTDAMTKRNSYNVWDDDWSAE